MASNRPSHSEYNEYYKRYIDQAQGESIVDALEQGLRDISGFFQSIPEEKHDYSYQPGKWTPKDILVHIIDTERVFTYRALQFARAENVVLEGYEQDEFAGNAHAHQRSMEQIIKEYEAVRAGTIQFAKSCSEETLLRNGIASNSPLSVRAALYIIAGHERHHRTITEERYL